MLRDDVILLQRLRIKERFWFFTHDNSELLLKCVREVRRIYDHLDTMNNENSIKTCRPVYVGYDWRGQYNGNTFCSSRKKLTNWCFFSIVGGVICNFCIAEHGSRCHCCQFCASCCK